jgi:Fic family protein
MRLFYHRYTFWMVYLIHNTTTNTACDGVRFIRIEANEMIVPKSIPWYRKFREKFTQAFCLLDQNELGNLSVKEESIITFDKETKAQFIFESNNIEKEGLSFGETKKLVFSDESEGVNTYATQNNIKIILNKLKNDISPKIELLAIRTPSRSIIENVDKIKEENLSNISLIAKYGIHAKDVRTVYQHLVGTLMVDLHVNESRTAKFEDTIYRLFKLMQKANNPKIVNSANKYLAELFPRDRPEIIMPSLLNEPLIKDLHKEMASGLIEEGRSPEGEYRKHPVMTDMETNYPAPEAIPDAMGLFFNQFQDFEKENLNPIFLASWASTRLVAIHPFSDFNGRISRLIMNLVLRSYGVNFWISMKSSSRERKKYFTALRHYHRHNLFSISTLLSNQIIDKFELFNNVLSISNYPQYDLDSHKDEFFGLTDEQLLHSKWISIEERMLNRYLKKN